MADASTNPGDTPLLNDPHRTNEDARLIRRAVRNGWGIPPDKKRALMEKVIARAEAEEDVGKFTNLTRAALEMNAQDIKVELELMKSDAPPPPEDEETIVLPEWARNAAKRPAPPPTAEQQQPSNGGVTDGQVQT
jgi:hypothetical protein